jgi:hypothetical protein
MDILRAPHGDTRPQLKWSRKPAGLDARPPGGPADWDRTARREDRLKANKARSGEIEASNISRHSGFFFEGMVPFPHQFTLTWATYGVPLTRSQPERGVTDLVEPWGPGTVPAALSPELLPGGKCAIGPNQAGHVQETPLPSGCASEKVRYSRYSPALRVA